MLLTGFTLASLTVAGFYMIYQKIPRKIRRFLERHSLLTDLVACLLTYSFLGGTLVALFASAIVGLMVSALLHIASHQDNFLYLFDFAEKIKSMLKSLSQSLNEYGAQYRQEKLAAEGEINV